MYMYTDSKYALWTDFDKINKNFKVSVQSYKPIPGLC